MTTLQISTRFPFMPMMNPEERKTWHAFLHASTRLVAKLDDELRTTHNERLTDFDVLSNLWEAPDGTLRMSQLAEQTLFSRSRLTYTVSGLETRGLVIRKPDAQDGRGVTATLTSAGRRLHKKLALTHVQGIRSHFLDRIPPQQQSQLTDALGHVVDGLEPTTTTPD